MNVMQQIQIEKLTLNMGTGGPGVELEKALKLLTMVTGKKPIETKAGPSMRIPTWGVRPGLALGAKVTLRGKEATELLKRLLVAIESTIPGNKFDVHGNFSFGVPEYIDIPGTKYDASIGIIGFEVAVTLKRPGFRIKRRRIRKTRIPTKHKISKEQAMQFAEKEFGIKTHEEEEE
jgi:large subunit ribosomal protein L5